MSARVLLLGATGYTGALALESLLRRGVKPLVAGRNSVAVRAVAEAAGGLEYAHADITDPASLPPLMHRGDVVISTVGPFERYGYPVAEAGAHYIDSTGEVGFVLNLRRQLDDRARDTGSIMLPAFGYDYVPGVLAGALAAKQAGDELRHLDIGYFATGPLWRGLSQGTRTTMREGLTLPSARWRNEQLVDERTASRFRSFTVAGRRKNAFLVSGTEVLYLPTAFPSLNTVTVYNGWFPAMSRAATALSALTAAAAKIPGRDKLIDLLTRPVIGPAGGPDNEERARTRTHVVALASSDTAALAEVHLEGPSIYDLTAELIAWAAQQLATRPLGVAGVLGPVDVLGLDALSLGCSEVGLAPSDSVNLVP